MTLSDEILQARASYQQTWGRLPTRCELNGGAFAELVEQFMRFYGVGLSITELSTMRVFGMHYVEVDGPRRVRVYDERLLPMDRPGIAGAVEDEPLPRRAFALGGTL